MPTLVWSPRAGAKACLVTVDTGAYVTVETPNITTGWPERQLNQCLKLQMTSGEAFPILKEVYLRLNLGQGLLKVWVFITNVTNKIILGLGILHAYDASVNIRRQTLHLAGPLPTQDNINTGYTQTFKPKG
jgi:hypothetical protein